MGIILESEKDPPNLYLLQTQGLVKGLHMSICTYTDCSMVVAEVTHGELGKMEPPGSVILFSKITSSHIWSVSPGYSGKSPPCHHRLLKIRLNDTVRLKALTPQSVLIEDIIHESFLYKLLNNAFEEDIQKTDQ